MCVPVPNTLRPEATLRVAIGLSDMTLLGVGLESDAERPDATGPTAMAVFRSFTVSVCVAGGLGRGRALYPNVSNASEAKTPYK